ncbi:MAG TPA: DUF642 domain-containing protein [Methylomirabilota bacterium]|nr:DUF642 domain-containing protein [Methylomirabilota bacterium]
MKRSRGLQFLGTSLAWFAAVYSSNANLILNGDFESPTVASPFEYRTGDELDNWTITTGLNGVVQFDSNYRPVADGGLYSLEIEFLGDTISQSFSTSIGSVYRVSFDLAAYDAQGSTLGVSVAAESRSFDGVNTDYTPYFFDFTAEDTTSTLTFEKLGIQSMYPHFDNVSVEIVPVPEGNASLIAAGFLAVACAATHIKRCQHLKRTQT